MAGVSTATATTSRSSSGGVCRRLALMRVLVAPIGMEKSAQEVVRFAAMRLLILPIALLGLTLSSCAGSGLKDNFTEADQQIDTPWTDYTMPATGIEFAYGEESISLQKGETHTYQYTILPRGATANSLNWFTYDENVATVNQGVVTAVGGGQTTITASSPENAFDPVELSVNVVVPLYASIKTFTEFLI